MIPEDLEHVALWWGPGILLLLAFGYGSLRLAHYLIDKSTGMKTRQTESALGLVREYIEQFLGTQRSQADALSRFADTVEHRESVESFEHQEMLIALKAMHRDLDSLYCRRQEPSCVLRANPAELDRRRALVSSAEVSDSRAPNAGTPPGVERA